MITLENNALIFRFPEVHAEAVLRVEFQRTLRIPDDNREYPLPPGLGHFPLRHVDDDAARVPAAWLQHGGVFLPMYQAEALWLLLGTDGYPFAVKVAAGKINAVTGELWRSGLNAGPQDYLVAPSQPWLDGFCVAKGKIRQFVAMPLGEGYTAEEQLTGEAEHGGLQIIAYPMKAERWERLQQRRAWPPNAKIASAELACCRVEMGLAPGGLMKQEIYEDRYGLKAWETSASSRCFVHILNSLQYREITGHAPPSPPPTAQDYTRAGLPWFDYYDAELQALAGSAKLGGLRSVGAIGALKDKPPLPDNSPVAPSVVHLGPKSVVREGDF